MARIPTRVMLLVAALALAPTVARAQDCPGPSTDTFQGSLWWGESTTVAVNLLPCQTVSFDIATNSNPAGALLGFKLLTDTGAELLSDSWITGGTGDRSEPSGSFWVPPFRGTRGSEGLAATATLSASAMGWQVYAYTIVMTKQPRPGYNLGGTSFANAPLISIGATQYGSLNEAEPGQFYKIHLESNQRIFFAGQATGPSVYGTLFQITLYDSNQQWLQEMVSDLAYGTAPFPGQDGDPVIYTNAGGPADFYIRARANPGGWPTFDFQFVAHGPDTVVFDGFNGGDNSSIDGRPPLITPNGNTWTVTGTPGAVLLGDQAAVSGQPQAVAGEIRMLVDTTTADGVFAVDWTAPPAPDVPLGGLIFRATDAANYWMASYGFSDMGPELWKVQNGVWTLMGQSEEDVLFAPSKTHHLEVRASGTSIGVWWDGVLQVAAEDGFNATATKAGLYFYPPADWLSRFDNFFVTRTLACVTTAAPSAINVGATGGNVSVSITAPSGCGWHTDTDAPWLTLSSPANGTGTSAVSFLASQNDTGITRVGTIIVDGQAVLVTQPPTVPGANPDIGSPPAAPPAGTVVYYHTDAIGSVRMTTDQNGQVIARYDFLPFGEQWNPQASDPRMFTGAERDNATGFDYLTARYYSNLFGGRFTTPDNPAFADPTNPQSWNLYSYALNNPLSYVDPTGHVVVWAGDLSGFDEDTIEFAKQSQRNLDEQLEAARGAQAHQSLIARATQAICGVLPSGNTTGVQGGLGLVGGVVGGGELVVNYNSGQVSGFLFGGAQVGWNGGASGSGYTGLVRGLNNTNSNYSGPFTGFNYGAGLGIFGAASSGGLTHGFRNMIPTNPEVKVLGVSATGSVLAGASGGVTVTHYTAPKQLGRFWGFTPTDWMFYLARRGCQ